MVLKSSIFSLHLLYLPPRPALILDTCGYSYLIKNSIKFLINFLSHTSYISSAQVQHMTTGCLPYRTLKRVLLNSPDPDTNAYFKNKNQGFPGSSVVRIRLPKQETQVQLLDQEDPTCRRATKPERHNRLSLGSRARSRSHQSPLESVLCDRKSHLNEKPTVSAPESSPCSMQPEQPAPATAQHSQNSIDKE